MKFVWKIASVMLALGMGVTQATAKPAPGSLPSCDGQVFEQTFRSKGDTLDLRQTDPNDVYTITVHNPGTFSFLSSGGICSSAGTCNGATFSFGPSQDRINISGVGDGVNSRISVSCSNGPSSGELRASRDATGAVGRVSHRTIEAAFGKAIGARRNGSAPVLSSSGLFLSTQGPATALSQAEGMLWVNVQGTQFDGILDGSGGEFSLGGDIAIGQDTFLGAVLSFGSYNITSGGTSYETEALSFGPYLSARIWERYAIDAYLVFAQPDYTVGTTTYSTDRVSGGLKASAEYELGGYATTSHLGISGFTEDLPAAAVGGARTIQSVVGSIGMRVDFAPGAATRPYASLSVESINFKDGATKIDSVSPRIGLGVDMSGRYGNFNMSLDAGEVFDAARAITIGFTWKFDL